MATLKSDLATLQDAQTGIHTRPLDARLTSGNIRYLLAEYTILGTEAVDDVLKLGKCRKGMLIIPHLIRARVDSGAYTGLSLKLGVAYDNADLTDDDDALMAAGAWTVGTTINGGLLPKVEIAGEGWLQAVLTAVDTPVAGKKIHFAIPYVTV